MDSLQTRLKRYAQLPHVPERLRDSLEEGLQQRHIAHAASVLLAHTKEESETGDWAPKQEPSQPKKYCRNDGDFFKDLIRETENIIANVKDRIRY